MKAVQSCDFDVVIAGGAMTGSTLALALSHQTQGELRIAIVEPFESDHTQHPGFDGRSIALSHGTTLLLESFGLWQDVMSVAEPITHIHVSDRSHAGMTDISPQHCAVPALGYVVELADVGRVYHEKLTLSENITLICPNSVQKVERTTECVNIELEDGSSISSKLMVAADGALSPSCEQVGLDLIEEDFGQVALIANVSTSEYHQGQAYERFTEHGPLALLPMSDNRMSLVWCLPSEQADSLKKASSRQFLSELQRAFGWRLGQITHVGVRASYPLLLRYREQHISHRFVALGNASQTVHPIAGQGFNLGIRDVASLVEELTQSLDDVGQYSALSRYAKRRESDKKNTVAMTKSLVKLFSNDLPALRCGRNLGLILVDNVPLLKAPLLRQTLGLIER